MLIFKRLIHSASRGFPQWVELHYDDMNKLHPPWPLPPAVSGQRPISRVPGGIFPNSITRVVPGLSSGRCQPIRGETPSVTSLLAQQHGLAIQCDMNSQTSVLNFKSTNKVRRRSVEMFQVAIAACMFSVLIKNLNVYRKHENSRAWGSNPQSSENRQTRYLLRHIAAKK